MREQHVITIQHNATTCSLEAAPNAFLLHVLREQCADSSVRGFSKVSPKALRDVLINSVRRKNSIQNLRLAVLFGPEHLAEKIDLEREIILGNRVLFLRAVERDEAFGEQRREAKYIAGFHLNGFGTISTAFGLSRLPDLRSNQINQSPRSQVS
jgi:hypothetical protein